MIAGKRVVGGDTPLHIACDDGNLDEVRRLLQEGWDPNALNLRHQTPLHLAARHYSQDYLPIVGLLVECGASVGAKDRDGNTPSQVCMCVRATAMTVQGLGGVYIAMQLSQAIVLLLMFACFLTVMTTIFVANAAAQLMRND